MGKWSELAAQYEEKAGTENRRPQGKWSRMAQEQILAKADMNPYMEETKEIDARTGRPRQKFTVPENYEPASFNTMRKAMMVEDPDAQMRIFAAARFPDMPEAERLKRYGVNQDGKVVYVGRDGQAYPEIPDDVYDMPRQMAAGVVSRPLSTALGTVGAAAGPLGAALGAAGGRGIERGIADLTFDARSNPVDNLIDMGVEGAMGAMGELGGRAMIGGVHANRARRAGDIARAAGRDAATIDPVEASRVAARGKRYGIDLYPPETTESAELINTFKLLKDSPATSKRMNDAVRGRADQIETAVYDFLDTISPVDDPYAVGEQFVGAAGRPIESLKKMRRQAAQPYYRQAYADAPEIDIAPVLDEIDKMAESAAPDGNAQTALKLVRRMLLTPEEKQSVKAAFTGAGGAQTAGPRTLAGRIKQAGGVNLGALKGDMSDAALNAKFLTRNSGVSIDSMEQSLKTEGWLLPDEDLLEIMRGNPERLRMGHLSDDPLKTKSAREMTPTEKKLREQLDYEPEAPPDGEYKTSYADDLETGSKRTMITPDGKWDEYKVVKKDGSGVTLRDGETIQLDPWDQVQLLDKRTVPQAKPPAQKEVVPARKLPPGMKPQTRIDILDNVKKEIDLMLARPDKYAIPKDTKRRLVNVKEQLVNAMDAQSESYNLARKTFKAISPAVESVENSIVGTVSKLEGEKQLDAARRIFNSAPAQVNRAKNLMRRYDPEAWDAAVKMHLQDVFESVKNSTTGEVPNLGGWYQKKIFGSTRDKQKLQAAMTPAQYARAKDFFDILRRTGLTYGKESATATRQVQLADMRRRSGSAAAEYLGNIDITRPASWIGGTQLSKRVQETLFGKYQGRLAEAMLSEDAGKQLMKLKRLSPKSQKYIRQLTTFLGLVQAGAFQKKSQEGSNRSIQSRRESARGQGR